MTDRPDTIEAVARRIYFQDGYKKSFDEMRIADPVMIADYVREAEAFIRADREALAEQGYVIVKRVETPQCPDGWNMQGDR